jgi:hypothetical protein
LSVVDPAEGHALALEEEDENGQPGHAPALQWDGHDDYSFTSGPAYGGYVLQRAELQP